jgi:Diacylglycerol kinase catalytic domain
VSTDSIATVMSAATTPASDNAATVADQHEPIPADNDNNFQDVSLDADTGITPVEAESANMPQSDSDADEKQQLTASSNDADHKGYDSVGEVLLAGDFGITQVHPDQIGGVHGLELAPVKLHARSIVCLNVSVSLQDVIGVERCENYLLLHSYPFEDACCGSPVRKYQVLALCSTDAEQLGAWKDMIDKLLILGDSAASPANREAGVPQRKPVLVLINPASGTGSSKQIFDKHAVHMFNQAGIQLDVQITQHAGHATEITTAMDLDKYSMVIGCGGDGTLVEIIHGWFERKDWQEAIRMPLYTLPTGSGNGLSASLLRESGEPFNITSAVFVACRGRPVPVNGYTFKQPGESLRIGFLNTLWGFGGDVDIQSEKWRWCGMFAKGGGARWWGRGLTPYWYKPVVDTEN